MYMKKQDVDAGIDAVVKQLEDNASACNAVAAELQKQIDQANKIIADKQAEINDMYTKMAAAINEAVDCCNKAKKIYEAK